MMMMLGSMRRATRPASFLYHQAMRRATRPHQAFCLSPVNHLPYLTHHLFSSKADQAKRAAAEKLQQQKVQAKIAEIAKNAEREEERERRKNPQPEVELDRIKKDMENLFISLKGDEFFIPKTLKLLDDALNNCLEFSGREEVKELICQLAEEMMKKAEEMKKEVDNEEEYVKGVLKIITIADALISGSVNIAKVLPNSRAYRFKFETKSSFEGALNEALYLENVEEEEALEKADEASFIVIFISFKAWILKVKKTDICPPFKYP